MRLLLINHYAGSPALGMEFRPYHLAREWARQGHSVRIMAASQSHVRARQPECEGAERIELTDGVEYHWLRTPAYRGNGAGRMANVAVFLARLWRRTRRLAQEWRPDVVIASSTYPLDIWVAKRLARLARARLVYEVHDLWPLSLIELAGMSPRHPFARLCQRAEDRAYRDADLVVSMLPRVHAHMQAHGLDLRRLTIVPNGVSTDAAPADEPLREDVAQALAAARGRGDLLVGYAGSMGLPNALDTLLDAATLLRGQAVSLVLVGDGHERGRLMSRVLVEGLERVQFFAPIPKAQVPAFLQSLDVAYIGWQRQPIYRFGIAPNKLMDYMLAGCAVLHAVEAGNDPVAESEGGVSVAPESPQAIVDGLARLRDAGPQGRRAMGDRGRAWVRQHHAYDVLASRFIAAIETLAPLPAPES